MKGFIAKTVAGLGLGSALGILSGCYHYDRLVDPCYPERYTSMARASVREAFNAQAANGHVLDQTVWNYHFEHDALGRPTDQLNQAGRAHLNYLSRRRDLQLFLATAQDVVVDPNLPADKVIAARVELDQKRAAAVQNYMAVQLSPRGVTIPVQVAVIDAAETGIFAPNIGGTLQPITELRFPGAYQKLQTNFQGVLPPPPGLGNTAGAGGAGTNGGR